MCLAKATVSQRCLLLNLPCLRGFAEIECLYCLSRADEARSYGDDLVLFGCCFTALCRPTTLRLFPLSLGAGKEELKKKKRRVFSAETTKEVEQRTWLVWSTLWGTEAVLRGKSSSRRVNQYTIYQEREALNPALGGIPALLFFFSSSSLPWLCMAL